MGKVRIKDIAQQAGVSAGTVDRVIHERGRVSDEVKARVRQVMNELGYSPNLVARSLASKKEHSIASLVPAVSGDQYWEQTNAGMHQAKRSVRDFNVAIDFYYYDQYCTASFLRASEDLLQNRPDAIVLAPLFLAEGYRMIKIFLELEIPVVLINTDINFPGVLSYIGQNSFQAGKLAARLLDFGLEEKSTVLLLNLDPAHVDGAHLISKEQGFRTYFQEQPKSKVHIVSKEFSDFKNRKLTKKFLDNILIDYSNISGIFVTNSRAHHVVDALDKNQLKKINIVGFDLIEPNLKYLKEGYINFLLNQNPHLQGYWGVMNLVNYLLNPEQIQEKQYLPLDVVMVENLEYYINRELPLQVLI